MGVVSKGRMRNIIVRSMFTDISVTRLVCESGVHRGGGSAMRMGVVFGTYAKDSNHFVGVGAFGSRSFKGDDMFTQT